MKAKKIMLAVSLVLLLAFGLYAVIYAKTSGNLTYDGSDVDVTELYENPEDYDTEGAAGVADIIVKENLERTMAVNNVAAVVFDYRGYDTLGESFILLTAIAGSFVILSRHKKEKKEDGKQ